MARPIDFSVKDLGRGNYVINEHGRTIAIVTRQGYIDWLLRTPLSDGPLIEEIRKETHLCYVIGFKLLLITPKPATHLESLEFTRLEDGHKLRLTAIGRTKDGSFRSRTEALLFFNEAQGEYQWDLTTELTCTADEPVTLSNFEYNNVYPGKAGRCFMFASQKEYHSTLMEADDGTIWAFPHQHMLHYFRKIETLDFPEKGMAGFFGEQSGSPVVITRRCSLPVTWAICDMYYDLHCMVRVQQPFARGDTFSCDYTIRYLSPLEARNYQQLARRIEISDDDFSSHDYPRLELGMNAFSDPVALDRFDDASGFRPKPPARVWEKAIGVKGKGALRLTNAERRENAWSAEPPTQIPASSQLTIAALARTRNVAGKGFFIRVRYHTFVWDPEPHVEWTTTLESEPLTGTHNEWTHIQVPLLDVPVEHFDYLVWIDVVLDGEGTAWLTDVDVDLVRVEQTAEATV